MRGVASLSSAADMPLAFLVKRIGVACLADLWRIELQCALPCKPFRLYPDAPLAHLIGTLAKQGGENGETSLGSPPILRLAAFASASPLAISKWLQCGFLHRQTKGLTRSAASAFMVASAVFNLTRNSSIGTADNIATSGSPFASSLS